MWIHYKINSWHPQHLWEIICCAQLTILILIFHKQTFVCICYYSMPFTHRSRKISPLVVPQHLHYKTKPHTPLTCIKIRRSFLPVTMDCRMVCIRDKISWASSILYEVSPIFCSTLTKHITYHEVKQRMGLQKILLLCPNHFSLDLKLGYLKLTTPLTKPILWVCMCKLPTQHEPFTMRLIRDYLST